jgi:hypothetical protein
VITAPLLTVPLMLALKFWLRSVVSGFGLVAFVVFVVANVPLQVSVTGFVPVVAQSAQASEPANDAAAKDTTATVARTGALELARELDTTHPTPV